MNPFKSFAALGICLGISSALIVLSYHIAVVPGKHEPITARQSTKVSPPKEGESSPDAKTIEAATPNQDTAMYILKYNRETDTVLLITKKEDGTELISPVESINTTYLTESDINALTEGIELSSREDMFILIEDYSS